MLVLSAIAALACTSPAFGVEIPEDACIWSSTSYTETGPLSVVLGNSCEVPVHVLASESACIECALDVTIEPDERVTVVFDLPENTVVTVPWSVTPAGEDTRVVSVEYLSPTEWDCGTEPFSRSGGGCRCASSPVMSFSWWWSRR